MILKDPWVLTLIPVLLGTLWWFRRKSRKTVFRFSSLALFSGMGSTWRTRLAFVPELLRILALILFVVSLSGPRLVLEETKIFKQGIDIMLVLDASDSMAAEDFVVSGRRASRFTVVKNVLQQFILKRESDKIGLIAFGRYAFTACPLTVDHDWLLTNLSRIRLGVLPGDKTAIGSAISSGVLRLKESETKSKVMILLTDGQSNFGSVDPLDAAEAARALGIKVYTIGAGSDSLPPDSRSLLAQFIYNQQRVGIDDGMLKEIATRTGGQYFRATDTESLVAIYDEIDRLEKTKIEEVGYRDYTELFPYTLGAALALLMLELVLRGTVWMRIP